MENDKEIRIVKGEFLVRKSGDSFYLLISKPLRERLHIEEGMIVGAKIWNIELKEIECPKCHFKFEDYENRDPHDCPSCGEEFLDVDKIETSNAQEIEEEKKKEVQI